MGVFNSAVVGFYSDEELDLEVLRSLADARDWYGEGGPSSFSSFSVGSFMSKLPVEGLREVEKSLERLEAEGLVSRHYRRNQVRNKVEPYWKLEV